MHRNSAARKAERKQANLKEFEEFKSMIERPMGINEAVGRIMKDPEQIAVCAKVIECSPAKIRSRAAWAVGYAAAKFTDIWMAKKALIGALDDNDADVRRASAYALVCHYQHRDNSMIARLQRHSNAEVRMGAHLAMLDLGSAATE